MKRIIALGVVLGLALAQGSVYKLKVTDWSCRVVGRDVVAQGRVLNRSGMTLRAVRVNLRVVDRTVSQVNGVSSHRVRGTNSGLIQAPRLANGASSAFVVRVRPSTTHNVTCQIWFRNPDVVQIPTQVPLPR
ncbi:hypothetical protein [Meiothermus granaticius]|uniref:Uncharacterized protein n=1 Tax=Meiothermus granaticius NBRC 107808 TaxID=1227551 RepID=A0A399F9J3_9DEIN|nr:hypothetical protein [Meiothermus granaticius]MCL6525768.1 hypothetical protein [Thermaceae bacterium]RIH92810.1 hypothetical protein Mgrana_01215 [Meiothermus granaticius NBRC 107808]GEM85524.1 hypothetical protein MGR01S_01490 [Meiothermus granaticius NBRC 107808]